MRDGGGRRERRMMGIGAGNSKQGCGYSRVSKSVAHQMQASGGLVVYEVGGRVKKRAGQAR